MGRFSRLTRRSTRSALPALSLAVRGRPDGRPLAMQLVGRPFEEEALLRLGDAYEPPDRVHRRRPALGGAFER